MDDASSPKELCRLCGQDRVNRPKRKPSKKEHFHDIIQKVIGISVKDDDVWMPKYVCRGCILKLRRQKQIKDRQRGGTLCVWNIPAFSRPSNRTPFEDLIVKLSAIAIKHGYESCCSKDRGIFFKHHPERGDDLKRVEVNSDHTWKVQFRDKNVPKTSSIFQQMSSTITANSANTFLHSIAVANACPGNADLPLLMSMMKNDVLLCHDKKTVAGYKDGGCVRAVDCHLLNNSTNSERCIPCETFRSNLYGFHW